LVELLVVVGIVGVLAGLLLPALSRSKATAQRVECVGNLRQLGLGVEAMLENNHGYPLLINAAEDGDPNVYETWVVRLEREGLGIARPETNFFQKGVWRCPAARWSAATLERVSPVAFYGYNRCGVVFPSRVTNEFGLQGHFDLRTQTWTAIAEAEVATPSDMIEIGDCYNGSVVLGRRKLAEVGQFGNFLTRHQGKANVVFCDGHVESPRVGALLEEASDAALMRWNRDHLAHREAAGL
jgi:prepilin-type processing-associated H-X9-DG protein